MMRALSQWSLAFSLLLFISAAHSTALEKLLMPGPVISGHEKYEESCEKCHTTINKGQQRDLCNACHKEVSSDITEQRGYHGRIVGIDTRECRDCHSDHLGRDADVVKLAPQSFAHDKTDFVLKGRHQGVICSACHVEQKKYRDAESSCIACHREDDKHKESLGDKCQDCHSSDGWDKQNKFDHDKTEFALTGKHPEVSCQSCHPGNRFKETPKQCVSCHRSNDIHYGDMGKGCDSCHTTESWDKSKFDHKRDGNHELRGKHKEQKCSQCHSSAVLKSGTKKPVVSGAEKSSKTARKCIACHSADDSHLGRNGAKCESCHGEEKWSDSDFDHKQASGYALFGKHQPLKCNSCHSAPIYEVALERSCYVCHKSDDVHKQESNNACEKCHNESGWGQKVKFDHDLTSFPLNGLHTSVVCEECHVNQQYQNTHGDCQNCHKEADQHRSALGENCSLCHNPNGWSVWRFSHDEQTAFSLTGKHKGLACEGCHIKSGTSEIKTLSTQCAVCHRDDDVHQGSFGLQCDRCHASERFDDLHLMQ
jgi:hypothetical protein